MTGRASGPCENHVTLSSGTSEKDFQIYLENDHQNGGSMFAVSSMVLLLLRPFYGPLSGTAWVSRYQKQHSPTHHPDHHPIFISFFHLRSILPVQLMCLTVFFAQPLSKLSLAYLLLWSPPPRTAYILHLVSVFFLLHLPIPWQPVLL